MTIYTTPACGVQSYARKRQLHRGLDFQTIAAAARISALPVCQQLLPGGKRQGNEYVARNPKRVDAKAGSFKINLKSGCWADFAIGMGGRDLISLVAYLHDLRQGEAAKRLAAMLHLDPRVRS